MLPSDGAEVLAGEGELEKDEARAQLGMLLSQLTWHGLRAPCAPLRSRPVILSLPRLLAHDDESTPLPTRRLRLAEEDDDVACVTLVCVSDTHGFEESLTDAATLPAGDVLIHCGDFATEAGNAKVRSSPCCDSPARRRGTTWATGGTRGQAALPRAAAAAAPRTR